MANVSKKFKRWLIITASLLLLLIAAITVYRLSLNKKIENHLQKLRDAGYPTTLAELDAWYPHPPQGQNAADLYLQDFEHLITWPEEKSKHLPIIGDADLPEPGQPITEKTKADIAKFLADNAKTLELLHRATELKHSRYPANWFNESPFLPSYLGGFKHSSKNLRLEVLSNTENGLPNQAVRSITALFQLSGSSDNAPLLVSYLIKLASQRDALNSLNYLLNCETLTTDQINKLSDLITKAQDQLDISSVFISERCWALSKRFHATDSLSTFTSMPSIFIPVYRAVGLYKRDHLIYLETMHDYIAAVSLPITQRIEAAEKVKETSPDLFIDRFSESGLEVDFSHYFRTIEMDLRTFASLFNADTALAIEQYRLTYNRLPEKLDDLVPQYIDTIPLDPFDGQPLRYKKLDKGYTVYSIGPDKIDNDGLEKTLEGFKNKRGTDIAFTVRR